MDKLQRAIQDELASRLKAGKIKSSNDLSDIFSEMFREGIQVMLHASTDNEARGVLHQYLEEIVANEDATARMATLHVPTDDAEARGCHLGLQAAA